jgi:hypothetical protein
MSCSRQDHLAIVVGLEHGPVGGAGSSRVAKQPPARLGVGCRTMKTLVIGLGTLMLVARRMARPPTIQGYCRGLMVWDPGIEEGCETSTGLHEACWRQGARDEDQR